MRALKENVMMGDILAENKNGVGAELSSDAKNAFGNLLIIMKSVCMVYEIPFDSLLEAEKQYGEEIIEVGHAVTLDPLKNSAYIVELSNWEHRWLHLQDMVPFVELLSSLRSRVAHGRTYALH